MGGDSFRLYARNYGFTRIVTNHRASNRQMIELNGKFGFRIVRRRTAIYYQDAERADSRHGIEVIEL